MTVNRRTILLGSLGAALAAPAKAAPLSTFGLDAAHFGVRAGAAGDQSGALQRAIDQAAQARVPLMLAPGVYRAGGLTLPAGANLIGIRGATRLILTQGLRCCRPSTPTPCRSAASCSTAAAGRWRKAARWCISMT